ncbi:unnamed protein product [Gulo gulo]|uniref:Uncharacterized protein n=1 Tax=Gulo gulo TaxID=48420 RepID=A0A9X9Q2T8_GULGU|nr:unnamed protein product [Gulo gulo]
MLGLKMLWLPAKRQQHPVPPHQKGDSASRPCNDQTLAGHPWRYVFWLLCHSGNSCWVHSDPHRH